MDDRIWKWYMPAAILGLVLTKTAMVGMVPVRGMEAIGGEILLTPVLVMFSEIVRRFVEEILPAMRDEDLDDEYYGDDWEEE